MVRALIDAAVRGELTETQARQLYQHGPEVVTLVLMTASKRIAEQDAQIAELQGLPNHQSPSPSTPSGQIPVYAKPNTSKRRKRPGAKPGHPGQRRTSPTRIDRQCEHRLQRCPHGHGPLQRCTRTRSRIIEDIPEQIQPVVTEHRIHRDYCPHCRQHVEPVVPDALPNAMLGHHVISLIPARRDCITAWGSRLTRSLPFSPTIYKRS